LEENLEILECRLHIVKLGLQFYIFGEEIAVGEGREPLGEEEQFSEIQST
jgi:hypothetical protein